MSKKAKSNKQSYLCQKTRAVASQLKEKTQGYVLQGSREHSEKIIGKSSSTWH